MPGKVRVLAKIKISSLVLAKLIEPVHIDKANRFNTEIIRRLIFN